MSQSTPRRRKISLVRHGFITYYDPKPGVSISTLAYEYPPDFHVPEHAHGSDQVIYATHGVMEISAAQSLWVTPPQFAIWIPARTMHQSRMPGAVSMRTLYLRPKMTVRPRAACAVLHVSPFFRELIVEAVRIGELRSRNRLHCALRDLLVTQLASASPVPTHVTLPKDSRALAIARALLANPADSSGFKALCIGAGASVRTVERAFHRDVGVSFESWRRQLRLMKAVELLVAGHSVKEAAFAVGYRQPSAFVEMFRQTMGRTPRAWTISLGPVAK